MSTKEYVKQKDSMDLKKLRTLAFNASFEDFVYCVFLACVFSIFVYF